MTKSPGLLAALVFPAFVLAGMVANPALAQEKKTEKSVQKAAAGEVTLKEIEQNDKLRVYEATYKPGDVSPSAKRPMRVIHALKGGTLERTYADGTKETVKYKTGDTRIISVEKPYAVKNIGKGVVRLLVVALK
jgi:quercetin dioxygenase-like cupin family protein